MKHLVQRFIRYVTFDTQSNPKKKCCPSTSGQMKFAEHLKQELLDLGPSADVPFHEPECSPRDRQRQNAERNPPPP
ncbi:hypothetical protein K6U61_03040, partial [Vibrio vulnificus]|nr:hypothetical protein [Vibrio vulnificus]